MFDDVIVVYKFIGDLMFFVTGSQDENELILYQVLQGFYEAISLLLRYLPPSVVIQVLWKPNHCVFDSGLVKLSFLMGGGIQYPSAVTGWLCRRGC